MGSILVEFEQKCIDEGYFVKSPLKDIEASACTIPITEVIDFDKTKRLLVEDLNKALPIDEFKSCDCLKIIPELSRCDFIEIKGVKEYIKRLKNDRRLDANITKQMKKFALSTKYIDSKTVLHLLVQLGKFEFAKKKKEHIKNIEPFLLIVTDIDTNKDRMLSFALALRKLRDDSENKEVRSKVIDGFLSNVDSLNNVNPKKKILIFEKDLDEYYENINKPHPNK